MRLGEVGPSASANTIVIVNPHNKLLLLVVGCWLWLWLRFNNVVAVEDWRSIEREKSLVLPGHQQCCVP